MLCKFGQMSFTLLVYAADLTVLALVVWLTVSTYF